MSNVDCPDCLPENKSQEHLSESHTRPQPASKSEMASVAVPGTLAGPSSTGGSGHKESVTEDGSNQQPKEEAFQPPNTVYPNIIIEFCDRCRWAPRATWIQTELFLTFPTPAIKSIALIPLNAPETGGRFRVWLDKGDGEGSELLWDRKTEGGFPELKVLKQRLRNHIQPDMSLGHSDKPGTQVIQQA